MKAPNQQNSQLALFSDKGIGAQQVAELWERMGKYIPNQLKHSVHMNIKLIRKKEISEFSIGRVTVI